MIRFIDLGKQIAVDETDPEYPRQFAFFNTVSDTFMTFDGEQVFDCWSEFESAWKETYPGSGLEKTFPLDRFKGLCHEWVPKI